MKPSKWTEAVCISLNYLTMPLFEIVAHHKLTFSIICNWQKKTKQNDLNMLVCRTIDHENSSWCWSAPMNVIGISAFISTLMGFFGPYVEEAVIKFSTNARWKIRRWKSGISMEIIPQIQPCSVVFMQGELPCGWLGCIFQMRSLKLKTSELIALI